VQTDSAGAGETDEQLARRAAVGNESAFRQLFDRYVGLVYNVALRIVGRPQDAEEVMQEVFQVLHQELGRFRGESKFKTWLYQIATARAINARKKLQAYRARLARFAQTVPTDTPSVSANDEERVRRALDALPDDYRLLATLRYFCGLSYEEIAEVGGWPVGTSKSKMFRLHEALRNLLRDEEGPTR
jgi:RNA polymerase sigma-70 factor (ECF subfamily)